MDEELTKMNHVCFRQLSNYLRIVKTYRRTEPTSEHIKQHLFLAWYTLHTQVIKIWLARKINIISSSFSSQKSFKNEQHVR